MARVNKAIIGTGINDLNVSTKIKELNEALKHVSIELFVEIDETLKYQRNIENDTHQTILETEQMYPQNIQDCNINPNSKSTCVFGCQDRQIQFTQHDLKGSHMIIGDTNERTVPIIETSVGTNKKELLSETCINSDKNYQPTKQQQQQEQEQEQEQESIGQSLQHFDYVFGNDTQIVHILDDDKSGGEEEATEYEDSECSDTNEENDTRVRDIILRVHNIWMSISDTITQPNTENKKMEIETMTNDCDQWKDDIDSDDERKISSELKLRNENENLERMSF
ncbi:hypothetical protein EIN_061630 [Entamoeba invadens IP1]|uniref:hypothetical protein n=1 Tax=Entamoeba invadens IP1 TaxID=370355 RepID=UPI0002C3F8D2|nr:hypothetical protein EIN_061630 [Entamoeba invadens IP1]ELP93568.1 hypothetical protein EIN_061630 [Entamoeba invadens IP1]|eukprot:XP_004260339.1 hypothetical protein EIN_061630 [Entamoeba invadens IP1]